MTVHPVIESEDDYVIFHYQEMPANWFPETLLMVAKDGNHELAFTPAMNGDQVVPDILQNSVRALRQALWQKKETERVHEEWLRKNGNGNS